ncbi:MAG: MFS transporter [Desulfobacteraceae bacterium]|nr:MFS transporter [Desulfobacteraceae bacterium]
MKPIYKNRNIMILGIAETTSQVGAWITLMAIQSLIMFNGDGSVWDSSSIMLAMFLPTMIFSPMAGKLVDNLDKKRVMIFSELGAGLLVLCIYSSASRSLIIPLFAVAAILSTVMIPARTALVTVFITDETQYEQANAFLNQLNSLAKIGAPILAGTLVGFIGAYKAMIIDIVSFALSAILLFFLSDPPTDPVPASTKKAKEGGSGAFSFIVNNPALMFLFCTTILAAGLIISADVLGAIYVRDILGKGELFFGVFIGATGLGNVCGGLYILKRGKSVPEWIDLRRSLLLASVLPLTLGIVPLLQIENTGVVIIPVASFIGGIGISIYFIQRITMIQKICPSRVIGAMAGYLESATTAGFLSGFLIVPVLVPKWIGMDIFFLMCAVLILFLWACIMLAIKLFRIRPAPAATEH